MEYRPRAGAGRPRKIQADEAILAATAVLLGTHGYAGTTIDRIAERAGVARQTIYRRWPQKLSLVSALLHQISASAPYPDSGNLRTDLLALYRRYANALPTPGGPIIPALVGEALHNAELLPVVKEYILLRRQQLLAIFERAKKRGEIAAHIDIRIPADFMVGFTWYHRLLLQDDIAEDNDVAIVDTLLRGIASDPLTATSPAESGG